VLGGLAQWLFMRENVLSVTVSAAGDLAERSVGELETLLWDDVSKALKLEEKPVASRVIREKRATIFHSSAVEDLRPQSRVNANLFLAGDWTATGLPCTLEGAIASGDIAVRALLQRAS
jgi:uncharacterized protein with NAD-binding domain and iron-sulfur cluster